MTLTEDDKRDLKRVRKYVKAGDKKFEPYLDYLRNGKSRGTKGDYPVHKQARELINTHYPDLSCFKLSQKFGHYTALYYRLRWREYSRVPEAKAADIIRQIEGAHR